MDKRIHNLFIRYNINNTYFGALESSRKWGKTYQKKFHFNKS